MKEIFYFSHDLNARNDSKLQKIIMKYGIEGIGIYWCIVEMLYEDKGYIMLSECERIAFELRTDCKKIESIIHNFNLFETDNEKFWSKTIMERMKRLEEKSEKARKSALVRWNNANALQAQCDSNAIKQNKEKEKKIKTNKTIEKPERLRSDTNGLKKNQTLAKKPDSDDDKKRKNSLFVFLKNNFSVTISEIEFHSIINGYSYDRIKDIMLSMIQANNIRNPIGMLKSALNETIKHPLPEKKI